MTAVSPSSGCRSRREISVVLPLPRKPVTRTTGSLSAERTDDPGVERVERAAGQPLGLQPQRAEVLDHGRPALAVPQDVHATAPVVQPEPEAREDAVDERDPEDA